MVDMVFLVFIGFLYPPPVWKVFLLGQKSSPNDFLSVVVVYAFFSSARANFSKLPRTFTKFLGWRVTLVKDKNDFCEVSVVLTTQKKHGQQFQ